MKDPRCDGCEVREKCEYRLDDATYLFHSPKCRIRKTFTIPLPKPDPTKTNIYVSLELSGGDLKQNAHD